MEDGRAVFRFSWCEHRECRVYVVQKEGTLSLSEQAPCSAVYHRKLKLSGISDATVVVFPEKTMEDGLRVSRQSENWTPVQNADQALFEAGWKFCRDERYGTYFLAEHLSGTRYLWLKKPEMPESE